MRHVTSTRLPPSPALRLFVAVATVCSCALSAHAAMRVAFLPFKDNVRLKDTWNLGVDVPRYFSVTVDTIGAKDSALQVVPFDTVQKLIKDNSWNRDTYTSPSGIRRLASVLRADYLVTGTVSAFKVMKLGLNGEGPVDLSQSFGSNTQGTGGVNVSGGLQNYSAEVTIIVDIYSGATGNLHENIPLSTKERDGGFNITLPMQRQTPQMDFYNMSRSPFGSVYFQRSVPGVVMRVFSLTLKRRFQVAQPPSASRDSVPRVFLSGTVLERAGQDVYIDLGSADKLLQGEVLEVMKPDHPLMGSAGDTLGWAEKQVGLITVRFVKAEHFSIGSVTQESDTITTRCSVRTMSRTTVAK